MSRGYSRFLVLSGLVFLPAACATPPPAAEPPKKPTVQRKKPVEKAKPDDIVAHPLGLVDPVARIDARDYPFSAIGRLNLGGSGYCTAVLVGPDLVLSAASCLYNRTEGRWWGRKELFFQTAYQFEKAGQQAGVLRYAVPGSYQPGKRVTLASTRVDFAFLKLERPIGNRAGWLGLRWNDDELENDRLSRRVAIHHAGYARDRQHVQTVDAGCNVVAVACALSARRLALRPLAEQDGGFSAVPLRTKAGPSGRNGLSRITTRLLSRLGYDDPEIPAPKTAKLKPTRTVALLLRQLGYFTPKVGKPTPSQLIRGVRAFQTDNGRRANGKINLQLLADMLRAMHTRGRPSS